MSTDLFGGPLDTPRFVVNCETRIEDAPGGSAGYTFNGTYQFTVSAGRSSNTESASRSRSA